MRLLVLGSSHAAQLRGRLRAGRGRDLAHVRADGIPGGRLSSDRHRIRLLRVAAAVRPHQVLLIMGGNDVAARDFDIPELSRALQLMGLGLEALGVSRIWVLPLLPRESTRPGDVSATRYEERRRALHRIWTTRFRRAPITCLNLEFPGGMLGRDGVHLSGKGWEVVMDIIRSIK